MKFSSTNGIGKKLTALVMFCLLLVMLPGTLRVNAQGSAKLTASSGKAQRGDTVAVTFTLEENPGIWGMKFKVDYDHSALTLLSVANGKIFSDSEITPPESLDKERFVFLGCSDKLEDITVSGDVVTLTFSVAGSAPFQTYPVTLKVEQAVNLAGEDVKITAQSGNIAVKAGAPAAPTGITTSACTTEDNKDGVISGVDSTMEYRRAEDSQWTAVSGNSIRNLTNGTYLIRLAETPTALAGSTVTVTVYGYEEDDQIVEIVDQTNPDGKKNAGGAKTGDDSNPALWITLMLSGTGALLALILFRRKRNAQE